MKVFIATPSYDGKLESKYVSSLINTVNLLAREGHTITWFSNKGALLCRSRNMVVNEFLKSKADKLVFIDSDIIWDAKDFLKLINRPEDLVGGNYLKKDGATFAVNNIQERCSDSIAKIKALPTGFMKIERKVFSIIETKLNLKSYNDKGYIPFFQVKYFNNISISEDVWFCKQWRKTGGHCYVDLSIKLKHIGEQVFEKDPEVHFSENPKEVAVKALENMKKQVTQFEKIIEGY